MSVAALVTAVATGAIIGALAVTLTVGARRRKRIANQVRYIEYLQEELVKVRHKLKLHDRAPYQAPETRR